MPDLAFIGGIFHLFWETASENFIFFKNYSRWVLIIPALFNKGFDFQGKMMCLSLCFDGRESVSS